MRTWKSSPSWLACLLVALPAAGCRRSPEHWSADLGSVDPFVRRLAVVALATAPPAARPAAVRRLLRFAEEQESLPPELPATLLALRDAVPAAVRQRCGADPTPPTTLVRTLVAFAADAADDAGAERIADQRDARGPGDELVVGEALAVDAPAVPKGARRQLLARDHGRRGGGTIAQDAQAGHGHEAQGDRSAATSRPGW